MNQSEYFDHMRLGNFIAKHFEDLKTGKEVELPVRIDDKEEEIRLRLATVLRDLKEKWGLKTLSPEELKIKIKPGADIPRIDSKGDPIHYNPDEFSVYALSSIFQRALMALSGNQMPPGAFFTLLQLYVIPLRVGDRLRKLPDGTFLEDALFQMAKWMKSVFAVRGAYKEVNPEDGLSPSIHLLQNKLNDETAHFPPELIDAVFFQKEFQMVPLRDERKEKKICFSDIHLKPGDVLACIARKMEEGKEGTEVNFQRVEGTPEGSELGTLVHLETVADDAHCHHPSRAFLAVSEEGKVIIGEKIPPGCGAKYQFFGDRFKDLDVPDNNVEYEVLRVERK